MSSCWETTPTGISLTYWPCFISRPWPRRKCSISARIKPIAGNYSLQRHCSPRVIYLLQSCREELSTMTVVRFELGTQKVHVMRKTRRTSFAQSLSTLGEIFSYQLIFFNCDYFSPQAARSVSFAACQFWASLSSSSGWSVSRWEKSPEWWVWGTSGPRKRRKRMVELSNESHNCRQAISIFSHWRYEARAKQWSLQIRVKCTKDHFLIPTNRPPVLSTWGFSALEVCKINCPAGEKREVKRPRAKKSGHGKSSSGKKENPRKLCQPSHEFFLHL